MGMWVRLSTFKFEYIPKLRQSRFFFFRADRVFISLVMSSWETRHDYHFPGNPKNGICRVQEILLRA